MRQKRKQNAYFRIEKEKKESKQKLIKFQKSSNKITKLNYFILLFVLLNRNNNY